jgi:hypothetical protein
MIWKKDVKGSGRGLIWGIIPEYNWKKETTEILS